MTTMQAIEKRISRRSYTGRTLPEDLFWLISARLEMIAELANVRMELVPDGKKAFSGLRTTYGMFSGVTSFIACIAPVSDSEAQEKIGFYGELVMLEAVAAGLGTCWVGGTFDRAAVPCTLAEGEQIVCVITVGEVLPRKTGKEALLYKLVHRGKTPVPELPKGLPEWYKLGVKAAAYAPSAINRRPVSFSFENKQAKAQVSDLGEARAIDLGISKAHFALKAGGVWQWGNHAVFSRREDYPKELSPAIDALIMAQAGV